MKFSGRHFPKDMILQVIRWYISYPLCYRRLGKSWRSEVWLLITPINRWDGCICPSTGSSASKAETCSEKLWRMDETAIKIKGRNGYLYRAVDKEGNTVDFLLTKKRDKKAVCKAFRHHD